MDYNTSVITLKSLREANIVGEIHNLSGFPSSLSTTL